MMFAELHLVCSPDDGGWYAEVTLWQDRGMTEVIEEHSTRVTETRDEAIKAARAWVLGHPGSRPIALA